MKIKKMFKKIFGQEKQPEFDLHNRYLEIVQKLENHNFMKKEIEKIDDIRSVRNVFSDCIIYIKQSDYVIAVVKDNSLYKLNKMKPLFYEIVDYIETEEFSCKLDKCKDLFIDIMNNFLKYEFTYIDTIYNHLHQLVEVNENIIDEEMKMESNILELKYLLKEMEDDYFNSIDIIDTLIIKK